MTGRISLVALDLANSGDLSVARRRGAKPCTDTHLHVRQPFFEYILIAKEGLLLATWIMEVVDEAQLTWGCSGAVGVFY